MCSIINAHHLICPISGAEACHICVTLVSPRAQASNASRQELDVVLIICVRA
ncbi:hypothetical protein OG21DRAFT_394260 [Imleria badia]|nr:hypothetical protein OG21DRAFT_394260 [Imleria badia]